MPSPILRRGPAPAASPLLTPVHPPPPSPSPPSSSFPPLLLSPLLLLLLLLLPPLLASALPQPAPSTPLAKFAAGPRGITMFQHFSICTFTGCQWDTALPPASAFNPTDLDTDQWMEAALLLGASSVCLTVRHVDGFALWPTTTTNYSVAASSWRNGTGDVVADFVASAAKYGIEPCFYIILGFNIEANHSGVPADVYLERQRTAITELAAYNPVRWWWDNYALDGRIYQPVTHDGFVCPNNVNGPSCPAWANLSSLVKSLLPDSLIIPGPDGCLVNAEQDGGTYPLYRSAPQGSYGCTNADAPLPTNASSGPTTFMGVEADYTVGMPGDEWFWNPSFPVLSAAELWSQITLKRGQGANLILNVPPDNSGRVPDNIMGMLAEYRATYDATYNVPPAAVLDFPVTGPCPGLTFEVPVVPNASFDQILIMEDMTVNGQVVDGYAVDALLDGAWTPLTAVHGRTIGSRILDWGLGTISAATALRFTCTGSVAGVGPGVNATISHFAAYLGAPIYEPRE